MKSKLLVLIVSFAVVLSVAGLALAAPASVQTFTITPSTALAGDTVAFATSFTVDNTGTFNALCIYYIDATYDAAFAAAPAIVVSNLGDAYAKEVQTTAGSPSPSGHCGGIAGRKIIAYSVALPNIFADGGDSLSFSITVPAGAPTQTFSLRQVNAGALPPISRNATLTIQTLGNQVYVANDATGCGSNSPCLTGPTALNTAIDNVVDPGNVFVLGDYLLSATTPADLTANKTVTLSGVGSASINMAPGVCTANAAILVNGASANLTIQNLTIDGTCASGNRTAGAQVGGGTVDVRNSTLRDFGGSGVAVNASGGTAIVEGSTFLNNNAALSGSGGALYAFANNVSTNTGANAVLNIATDDNVKCNYWGAYNMTGTDATAQYARRLGAPVSTYLEGTGTLDLGRADLTDPGTNNRVIVSLGRTTPPFNNGTILGLGALTSDFFAFCASRGTTAANLGTITITSDPVAAGTNGHRLYHIADPTQCSPSTNAACWTLTGTPSAGGAVSAPLSPTTNDEGLYVIGNQVDPTAITLQDLSAESNAAANWPLLLGAAIVLAAMLIGGAILRKRAQKV
jgi:hypothetical protein